MRADIWKWRLCSRSVDQRSAERFLWVKELPAKDIHKEMLSVYNENCLFRQAVYCNIVSKLRNTIRRKRPGQLTGGNLFHHHNDLSHTARFTKEKIDEFPWQLIQHPPYSSELAPRFITCLVRLDCTRFAIDVDSEREVHMWLRQWLTA
ncbi:hypothetical protein AVEN_116999-1 [Araneus ventricosus]|uniref:Mariner Mos1 transposase n=1 Tax=Araneus ventricosus TaxID=182803 RepID=A0A4Y2JYK5_ARAVE|nr:hypothetical protein AVEN_7237-1 [Araneus ventricosus]GBM94825.1 hypothetical protein AVEN_44889-1 [Araneus ventricosus]GBM94830.1 hypothetical protein AVEN_47615-1 [Araneus ventricosus]GBM94907.1 hypothetical protein AVEN_116999-1 [Araneus ventricosus]